MEHTVFDIKLSQHFKYSFLIFFSLKKSWKYFVKNKILEMNEQFKVQFLSHHTSCSIASYFIVVVCCLVSQINFNESARKGNGIQQNEDD